MATPHGIDIDALGLNKELIADAKRRYDKAELEKQKIYRAIERYEELKRNRSAGVRLRKILGLR